VVQVWRRLSPEPGVYPGPQSGRPPKARIVCEEPTFDIGTMWSHEADPIIHWYEVTCEGSESIWIEGILGCACTGPNLNYQLKPGRKIRIPIRINGSKLHSRFHKTMLLRAIAPPNSPSCPRCGSGQHVTPRGLRFLNPTCTARPLETEDLFAAMGGGRYRWMPTAANVGVHSLPLVVAIVAVGVLFMTRLRRRRARANCCWRCGYDLRGHMVLQATGIFCLGPGEMSPSVRCPECGERIEPAQSCRRITKNAYP
jgi:hypothetical protein